MGRRRSAEEITELLGRYRSSGKSQVEYCRQEGVGISTLDRYLRQARSGQRLLQVNLETTRRQDLGFVLVLGNGRRIESAWKFSDTDLAKLIRIAEGL